LKYSHDRDTVADDGAKILSSDASTKSSSDGHPFGRAVTYLRVSVTDRCDLRCTYCMVENMSFLPKKDLLSLEELDRLCARKPKGHDFVIDCENRPAVQRNMSVTGG